MPLKKWVDAHLTRVTSSGNFIPQIDGLRFIAIATVVFHHISNYIFVKAYHEDLSIPTARYLIEARWGVPLFFIISGFIVALPFAKHILTGGKNIALRDYFLRRITRLEPPYILCLLLLFPLVLAVQHVTARSQSMHLVASMFYVHNLVYNKLSTINPVTWSLEAEIQFYILAPLLTQVYRLSTWLRRPLLVAAMLIAAYFQIDQSHARVQASFFGNAQYFLGGLLLADLFLCHISKASRKYPLWDLVSLIGWPLMCVIVMQNIGARYIFVFLAIAVYVAAFLGPVSSWIFSRPFLTVTGGMCYTIYLYHSAVISAVGRHLLSIHPSTYNQTLLLHAIVELPSIALISILLFAYVERPCMEREWPKQLLQRIKSGTRQEGPQLTSTK